MKNGFVRRPSTNSGSIGLGLLGLSFRKGPVKLMLLNNDSDKIVLIVFNFKVREKN